MDALINAKAETVAEKPAFQEAFKSVAADGFYEWQKLDAKAKQPYTITMNDRSLFCFMGALTDKTRRSGWQLNCALTDDRQAISSDPIIPLRDRECAGS